MPRQFCAVCQQETRQRCTICRRPLHRLNARGERLPCAVVHIGKYHPTVMTRAEVEAFEKVQEEHNAS